MARFEELEVWQIAKNLAVEVYKLTSAAPIKYDFGLRDQVRRCAVSIPSNIAEGDERDSNPESVRFFRIAKGSLGELRTQLRIAFEIGCLPQTDFEHLENQYKVLGQKLGRLIEVRKVHRGPSTENH